MSSKPAGYSRVIVVAGKIEKAAGIRRLFLGFRSNEGLRG
jgi:hypothetical protein